jgi:hypothetical protein
MTSEQFRGMLKAQPFVPFAIHLADGRRLRVDHPENAMVPDIGLTAAVLNPDGVIELVDLLLVTSLRPLNGRGDDRRGRKKSR